MSDQQPYVPYDPDFDQKRSQSLTLSITPKTLFFAGFAIGLLVMGVPMAYVAARSGVGLSAGSPSVALGNGAVQPSPSPSDAPSAPQPAGKVKPISKDDYVRGPKNADVTVVEYSDLECPFCKRFHPTVQQLMKEYDGKVAWVYRHFPLSFHANAQKEAEAAECAGELGGSDKYWKFIDTINERTTSNGTGFALDQLTPLAKEFGLNEGKFKQCLDSGKYAQKIQQSISDGQSAGVDGTPGTILVRKDGKTRLVSGAVPFEELKSSLEALLKE
ncbi:MAG: thioredoxin domain-containing protein [Patescibacteria group bacterium]